LQPVTQVDHVAAKRPLNADMMGVLKGSNAIIRDITSIEASPPEHRQVC
jgi:hypothetical protein